MKKLSIILILLLISSISASDFKNKIARGGLYTASGLFVAAGTMQLLKNSPISKLILFPFAFTGDFIIGTIEKCLGESPKLHMMNFLDKPYKSSQIVIGSLFFVCAVACYKIAKKIKNIEGNN